MTRSVTGAVRGPGFTACMSGKPRGSSGERGRGKWKVFIPTPRQPCARPHVTLPKLAPRIGFFSSLVVWLSHNYGSHMASPSLWFRHSEFLTARVVKSNFIWPKQRVAVPVFREVLIQGFQQKQEVPPHPYFSSLFFSLPSVGSVYGCVLKHQPSREKGAL